LGGYERGTKRAAHERGTKSKKKRKVLESWGNPGDQAKASKEEKDHFSTNTGDILVDRKEKKSKRNFRAKMGGGVGQPSLWATADSDHTQKDGTFHRGERGKEVAKCKFSDVSKETQCAVHLSRSYAQLEPSELAGQKGAEKERGFQSTIK